VDTKESGALRVALYIRVSTGEQAQSGYSIPDQERTLLDHAKREGWHVVETIVDNGWSGATDDRPGLRRIYELAEAGQIDAVLATKRDRFFRHRLYRLLIDRDMEEHGVRLVSLTDTGNRIGDGVQDDYADWEREQIRERTRLGKLQKARQGKVIGGHNRAAGYDWVRDANGKTVGYAVNEPEMGVVRRIFSEIGSGTSGVCAMKEKLDAERVPTPGRGMAWSRPTIRRVILDDLYKPHSVDELRELGVSETVLNTLDAGTFYGVYRYEGIPVPVPDAGILPEMVEAARNRVLSNRATRGSRADNRVWEISGGILRCAECGRSMQTLAVPSHDGTRTYHYYRCAGTTNGRADHCTMKKNVRAEAIEEEVYAAVSRLMDDKEYVLRKSREHFEYKRKEISRPGPDAASLAARLSGIERRWLKWQEAYEAGAISVADLKGHRAKLNHEGEAVAREMERIRNRDVELEKLDEAEREMRERIEATENNLEDMTPEKRRGLYQDLRIRVKVGGDKKPRISGFFPIGTIESDRNTAYVITSPEPLVAESISKKGTSPSRVAYIIRGR